MLGQGRIVERHAEVTTFFKEQDPVIPTESNAKSFLWAERGILALGILLRLRDYFLDRSFWLDEVMLARNVVERDFLGMFQPLDHDQGAPVGYLIAIKMMDFALGPRELSLRLVTLGLGFWSLFLFARLTRKFVTPLAGLGCLVLFTMSPSLAISSLKQYSVDVWVTLAILTLTFRVVDRGNRRRDYLWLAAAGAGLVWMSHTAPLILAAAGFCLLATHAQNRSWSFFGWTVFAIACWLTSFAANFLISIRHLRSNPFLVSYWHAGFPPLNVNGLNGMLEKAFWIGRALEASLRIPGGFKPALLAGILMLVGIARTCRFPFRLGLLVLPVVFALTAALAGQFPFLGRLVLFLFPFYLWLVGIGWDLFLKSGNCYINGVGIALMLILLLRPFQDARHLLFEPKFWEESRPALTYIAANAKSGDTLYVHPNGNHAFEYYRRFLNLDTLVACHAVLRPSPEPLQQLDELPKHQRLWVFHLDLKNAACPIEPLSMRQIEDALGSRLRIDGMAAPGATVVLFSPATLSTRKD